jgi:hypothetical protein
MDTSEPTRQSARQGFLRRLGYYAIGLALGFVLLGFFQQRRAGEKFLREQAAQTGQLERGEDGKADETPRGADSAPETPEMTGGA